jgi:hypothetical protein
LICESSSDDLADVPIHPFFAAKQNQDSKIKEGNLQVEEPLMDEEG